MTSVREAAVGGFTTELKAVPVIQQGSIVKRRMVP